MLRSLVGSEMCIRDRDGTLCAFIFMCAVVAGLVVLVGWQLYHRPTDQKGWKWNELGKDKKERKAEREAKKREQQHQREQALLKKKQEAAARKQLHVERSKASQRNVDKILQAKNKEAGMAQAEAARREAADKSKEWEEQQQQQREQRKREQDIVAQARKRGVTCKFVALGQSCHLGRKCPFKHVQPTASDSAAAEQNQQAGPSWVEELEAIRGATLQSVNSDGSGRAKLQVRVCSTQEAVSSTDTVMTVDLVFPPEYPEEPCSLIMTGTENNGKRNVIRMEAHEFCSTMVGQPMVHLLSAWLSEKLEAPAHARGPEDVAGFWGDDDFSGEAGDVEGHDQESSSDHDLEPEQVSVLPEADAVYRRGWRVLVAGSSLENVATVQCTTLRIDVSCSRCQARSPVQVVPGEPTKTKCPSCVAEFSLQFWPDVLHEFSRSLGTLKIAGMKLTQILPSDLNVSCYNCDATSPFPRFFAGTMKSIGCRTCHKKMKFGAEDVSFDKVGPPTTKQQRPPKHRAPKPGNKSIDGVTLGQPLPQMGACAHFKKSFRWLRFPCCDRAFACQQCHDDATTDGHSAEWAKKMLCGFCSKEQSFSNKACGCGQKLQGKTGIHWAGGSGLRDRHRLNSKDSRKITGTNENKKTLSAKRSSKGKK
eukprot:TRINITY_DN7311_c0_g1_i2.p1 TRINITY_DN7311_c0_g1~~TRINITY_DN7311_c0_g1_i2.p1  ORF type:complete len:649 (+),score=160.16 TRINITY_DN7311_c0_g1_i2:100-2046(+)